MADGAHSQNNPAHSQNNPAHSQNNPAHSQNNPAHSQNNPAHSQNNPAHSQNNPAHSQNNPAHSQNNPAHSQNNPAHGRTGGTNREERFRRLLLMVPYVVRSNGAPVAEVCERFGLRRSELVADLNLLFMCGLPGYGPGDLIEAYIDEGQVWIRMADYFSRPMRLTPAEGLLLYAGAQALAAVSGPDATLDRAVDRLKEALSPGALERVNVGLEAPAELATVKAALETRHRLHLVYQSQSKDEITERDVDPWALLLSEGRWYLVGYCHRVDDERIFRLDRMKEVAQTDVASTVPEDFDLSQYDSVYFESPQATEVTMDIAPKANWVCDYYPLVSQTTLEDGWIRIKLKAGGMAWLERLLLRLGAEARVVEPESLRKRLKATACAMAERYA